MNTPLLTNVHLYTTNSEGKPIDTSIITISPRANTMQLTFAFQLIYVTKNQPLKASVSIDLFGRKLIDSTSHLILEEAYLDLANPLDDNQYVASVSYTSQAFTIDSIGPAFLEIKIRNEEGTMLDSIELPFAIVHQIPEMSNPVNLTPTVE